MRLGNFNIRATPPMSRDQVLSDLRRARRTGARIFHWQELGKYRRYKKALFAEFARRHGWEHLHTRTQTITSVDTDSFEVVRAVSHKLTRGYATIPQPPRHTNETVVRSKLFDEYEVGLLNSHFTNGAFNGRHRLTRKRRRKLWDRQFEKTQQIVHRLHDAGLPLVGSGDYNRTAMPKFHPHQRWIIGRGVTKMWVLPAPGERMETSDEKAILELFTDHPGLAATIRRGL